MNLFETDRLLRLSKSPSCFREEMQKPEGNPLPEIDEAQDAVEGSYRSPSMAASLSSAVGDNAPKCVAAAFVLLCFFCFGPRGIAMALIVLAALRVTLGPVSSGGNSRGSSAGTCAARCSPFSCGLFCFLSSLNPPPPLPTPGGGGAARGSNIRAFSDLPKSNQGGG